MVRPATRRRSAGPQPAELHLDRLLGRRVVASNNRPVGRLEDVRAHTVGAGCTVAEYVIGAAGLFERLNLGVKLLFGRKRGGYVARWDQVDVSDPDRPRLTCSVNELQRL